MSLSDPIADMLTRIRNAARVRNREVKIPASKVKLGIAKVLQDEGYIRGFGSFRRNAQFAIYSFQTLHFLHGQPFIGGDDLTDQYQEGPLLRSGKLVKKHAVPFGCAPN